MQTFAGPAKIIQQNVHGSVQAARRDAMTEQGENAKRRIQPQYQCFFGLLVLSPQAIRPPDIRECVLPQPHSNKPLRYKPESSRSKFSSLAFADPVCGFTSSGQCS